MGQKHLTYVDDYGQVPLSKESLAYDSLSIGGKVVSRTEGG